MALPCAAVAQEQAVQWQALAQPDIDFGLDRVYGAGADGKQENADAALARRLLDSEAWQMETGRCFETPAPADLFVAHVVLDDRGNRGVLLLINNEENSWGDDRFTLTIWQEDKGDWRLVGLTKARMAAITLRHNPHSAYYEIETGGETLRWDGAGYAPRLRLVSAFGDRKGHAVMFHVPTAAEKKLVEHSFMGAYREAVRDFAPDAPAHDIKIAQVNLDERGAKEILVMIDSPLICGTIGCELTIWQKRAGRWQDIGRGIAAVSQDSPPVMLLDNKTAGYHDLNIGCSRHVWSGSSY